MLVGFHGYGQSAEDMLAELERLAGDATWTLASVQALHRFYSRSQDKVVACWMTRQDRELAIADNLAYVNRTLEQVLRPLANPHVVFVGFSQGVAMAYRAAILGAVRPRLVIAVGGDVPPDVVEGTSAEQFPRLVIAGGETDEWYTAAKIAADEARLQKVGVSPQVFRYPGGHEFTDDLRTRLRGLIQL